MPGARHGFPWYSTRHANAACHRYLFWREGQETGSEPAHKGRHKRRQKAEARGAAIKHMIKQRNGLETRSWCKERERERERRVHLPSRITDHTCFGKPVDICSHEAYMPAPTSPHVASLLNTVIFRGSSLPTRPLSGGYLESANCNLFGRLQLIHGNHVQGLRTCASHITPTRRHHAASGI